MKIIQIIKMPDNYTYQGAVWGLGDDGKVYEWYSLDGVSGWKLALDSVMYEAPEKPAPVEAKEERGNELKYCPDCGKEEFSVILTNTTTDLCQCIPF